MVGSCIGKVHSIHQAMNMVEKILILTGTLRLDLAEFLKGRRRINQKQKNLAPREGSPDWDIAAGAYANVIE